VKLVTFRIAAGREGRAPVPGVLVEGGILCFEKHLLQAFRAIGKNPPPAWYERPPLFYHPSRFSVCGPDAEVPWPAYTERLDFELEFGYTIFNDFFACDEQSKEMAGRLGPGNGKDFDNANAMGPCLVTADGSATRTASRWRCA
jgi:2-keto-4-pentenoate hydratase/2-oxohepta-3-ene-1,7-dioic acid hydratase in catechol pathway